MKVVFVLLLAGLVCALADDPAVYFKETFEDGDSWRERWVDSTHKSDYGEFKLTAGEFYGDAEKDKGLKTSVDAHFYATSAKFDSFSNRDKTIVVQFTVKHEQKIDCGGGYVKVFPGTLDQTEMHGDSQYNLMFGPDICGPGTKKVHVIFNYEGENYLIKKDIRCKDDEFTHLYTLIVRPDNTYEVKIDNEKAQSGSLEEDWDFLKPKDIPDPEAKKPEDWVDNAKINDPEDTKPEDWDQPEHIADPDAQTPEDWDEETDGEWEPPMIPNPEYKGDWKPKQIDNPDYEGEWVHPIIPNPEYKEDNAIYAYEDFGVMGLDLWQVKAGTIFDNFLITDSEEYAAQFGEETWGATKDPEKKMKDDQDAAEATKRADEEKQRQEEQEDDDDDEPDEDTGDNDDGDDDDGDNDNGDNDNGDNDDGDDDDDDDDDGDARDEL